jgi:hypothetical protein
VPPESLDRLQRRFWRLITAPEGVTDGLAAVVRDDPGAAPVTGWIAAKDEETARERLDVYANMYFFRLLEALESDLPKVADLLGHDAFHNLIVDYLLVHPSTNPSLRHAGRHMPEFLAQHQVTTSRPDLPDIARLDLARNDVFDAADSAALDGQRLATLAPEAWPRLRFRIAPAVRWLRLRASVVPTWRALSDGEVPPEPSDDLGGCVIWRSRASGTEDQVWHRASPLTELAALDAVQGEAPFESICEIFAAELPAPPKDAAEAAQPALAALVRWVADGLLSSVE